MSVLVLDDSEAELLELKQGYLTVPRNTSAAANYPNVAAKVVAGLHRDQSILLFTPPQFSFQHFFFLLLMLKILLAHKNFAYQKFNLLAQSTIVIKYNTYVIATTVNSNY